MKRKIFRAGTLIVISVLLVLTGCRSEPDELEFLDAPFMGKVYDTGNKPCPDVTVVLTVVPKKAAEADSAGEETESTEAEGTAPAAADDAGAAAGTKTSKSWSVVTDISGRFVIPALPRGVYDVTASKPDYETVTRRIDFNLRSQVLYIKIASVYSFLELLEEELDRRNYDAAEDYLARAQSIAPGHPLVGFYAALTAWLTGDYRAAADAAAAVRARGYKEPYLDLLSADIYQYGLNDPRTALVFLNAYAAVRGGDDVAQRIENLKKEITPDEKAESLPEAAAQ